MATLTDGVSSLFVGVRLPRLTSNRETVLMDVDGDIVGFHTGKLKCGCHDICILGFMNVHPVQFVNRQHTTETRYLTLDGTSQRAQCLLK